MCGVCAGWVCVCVECGGTCMCVWSVCRVYVCGVCAGCDEHMAWVGSNQALSLWPPATTISTAAAAASVPPQSGASCTGYLPDQLPGEAGGSLLLLFSGLIFVWCFFYFFVKQPCRMAFFCFLGWFLSLWSHFPGWDALHTYTAINSHSKVHHTPTQQSTAIARCTTHLHSNQQS